MSSWCNLPINTGIRYLSLKDLQTYFDKIQQQGAIMFTQDEIDLDPILVWFAYEHLPSRLQLVSKVFAEAAKTILINVPRSAERTVCFRKLLEAKDCAVRAYL